VIKIIRDVLQVFEKNQLFEDGIELIGSWCFQLYQKHLGAKAFPLRTQDIDFLIPNPHRGAYHPDFIKDLEELGFKTDFRSDGSLFLWNAEIKIEFITPEKGRAVDRAIRVKQLGLRAIPLRFVALLLEEPITVTEDGVTILIPNPTNFCLHKLIIASRRRNVAKGLKDLQQAIYTSVILNADETRDKFAALPGKWRLAILRVLDKAREEMPLFEKEVNNLMATLQGK